MNFEPELAALVLEYAHDMRRNSSGGDDYPWEWAKATADYLEELVRRSGSDLTWEKIEQIGREGRVAFERACAQVDAVSHS